MKKSLRIKAKAKIQIQNIKILNKGGIRHTVLPGHGGAKER